MGVRLKMCAAWALALCAATVNAFMPAGAPAHPSLRPAAAVSAKESHTTKACGPLFCGKRAPALSMARTMGRGNDSVAKEKSVVMESATYAKSIDTLFDLPRAVDEATDIEAMFLVVRVGMHTRLLVWVCLCLGYVRVRERERGRNSERACCSWMCP